MAEQVDDIRQTHAHSPNPRSRSSWPVTAKLLTAFLGLCTAALGVVGGLATLQVQSLQQAAAVANQKVSNQQNVIVQLNDERSQLESTNSTLEGQIAAAPGDTSAPTGDALPTGVSPRHIDEALTIQSNERVDLDAPVSNPRWDSGDGDADLSFYDGVLQASYRSAILRLPNGTASAYAACNVSGFSSETTLALNVDAAVGEYFCIRTSAGRIAGARITALSEATIVLSMKVWDPPVSG